MRSARLVEPGRFELEAQAAPRPGAGQVVVAVEGCGVCASNLGPWAGIPGIGYPLEPGAPGHEVYGRVAEVGAGVTHVQAGDAVTALSYNGFAEYDVAAAENVVALPEELAGHPVPGEPVACAVNVARRAGVRVGDTVVVLGAGFLGAILTRLVRRAGAAHVVAVSRREDALELAGRMGADVRLTYDDDVAGRVLALTGGAGADVVLECTGKQRPLDLGAELLRVRGRLVVAGYHQDGPRTVNMQLWNWRGLDVINAHERDPRIYTAGMEEAVRLLAEGVLDLAPLLTHFFPLEEINQAFATAAARPGGFLKAVVTPAGVVA
ncbi:MAG TPA: zinc-binding dehydrogenase [Longimicrobiales bacterium]|nr:zinc-binding dehydrogenase [Longimicrobiales bacterium]